MIEVLFEFGSETIIIVITGKDVKFGSTTYGAQLADISGMKLNYEGVIKEFPDLKDRLDWQEEAVLRFKDYIQKLKSEEEIYEYITGELEKLGYIATSKRRQGFRPIKLK